MVGLSVAEQPPLPPELPPLPGECSAVAGALLPPEPELEEEEGAEDEDAVYHVVDEVGADEGDSFSQNEEEAVDFEEQSLENEYEEEDLEELERLAQRKLEILKAIELPDSVVRFFLPFITYSNLAYFLLLHPEFYIYFMLQE